MDKERAPLSPYRVLDLTDASGVFCTKVLAALGADVIKIEAPGGDPTRRIGPFYHDEADPEKSLHWFVYNLNKRSITLNIESATGQELFRRLVKTADFIVECFPPGYLDGLGLGYSAISLINPRAIVTSISPWGQTGPYRQFKSSNLVISAASGFMYLCGDAERPPVQISTPVALVETGLQAAAATLVAHWYRRRSGEGQHIDVSAQECLTAQTLPATMLWKTQGIIPSRAATGTSTPQRPVHSGVFECKDGVVIAATTFARGRQPLREWLAGEGMAGDLLEKKWDPVFLEGIPISAEQLAHINELFQAFARNHTKEELMFEAQKRMVQVAKVSSVADVMTDPQLQERKYFVQVEHPELGEAIVYAGAPFKSDEMSWQYWRRAPFIGEHNQEIYAGEMGLSQPELAILREGGVI